MKELAISSSSQEIIGCALFEGVCCGRGERREEAKRKGGARTDQEISTN